MRAAQERLEAEVRAAQQRLEDARDLMLVAGTPIKGGHYGKTPSLEGLGDGDNLTYTTDFRRVYGTLVSDWLGVPAGSVLGGDHRSLGFLA